MDWLLLLFAVLLSSGRSIFSKKISYDTGNRSGFYMSQAQLFLAAGCIILVCNPKAVLHGSCTTLFFALIYSVLLITAQWCYTVSLQRGPTSICTMLYSFGFIFPTISGTLIWKEPFGLSSLIGLALTILAIVVSAFAKENTASEDNKGYIFPVLLAMSASGGLGIMQKVQQRSQVAGERDLFLMIAFGFAAIVSLCASFLSKRNNRDGRLRNGPFPILAGMCFGIANLLNTLLAGRIDSAILFPMQNIGVMLICAMLGIVVFRERISKKQLLALGIGTLAILVLSR